MQIIVFYTGLYKITRKYAEMCRFKFDLYHDIFIKTKFIMSGWVGLGCRFKANWLVESRPIGGVPSVGVFLSLLCRIFAYPSV